jgi:hypothetical protein
MPIGDVLVISGILSAFGFFMAVLGWGSWWSAQTPKPVRIRR